LLDSATAPPPVLDIVMVHVLEAEGVMLADAQVSAVIVRGPVIESEVDREDPFSAAVIVAVWSVRLAATVAVNVVAVAPTGTETEAGTVTDGPLLESATVAAPVFDSVTVHVLAAELTGVQLNDVTVNGSLSASEVDREDPLSAAVIVAAWSVPIAPAVAVNVAVVTPEGTATKTGTVTDALLLESATDPPVVFESVTVHVVDAPLLNVAEAQRMPLTVTAVVNAIDADCEDPFNAPVIVTD
jgi:hypothetical protein